MKPLSQLDNRAPCLSFLNLLPRSPVPARQSRPFSRSRLPYSRLLTLVMGKAARNRAAHQRHLAIDEYPPSPRSQRSLPTKKGCSGFDQPAKNTLSDPTINVWSSTVSEVGVPAGTRQPRQRPTRAVSPVPAPPSPAAPCDKSSFMLSMQLELVYRTC